MSVELDIEVVHRLEQLPEERILDYFWLMMRDGAEPLNVLMHLGAVKVSRPPDWDTRTIRHEHAHKLHDRSPLPVRRCFSCAAADRMLYFHHILEIQHGGSNARRNLIPICFLCHKALHPWLTTEPTPNRKGFEQVVSIMERTVDTLLPAPRVNAS